MKLKSWSAPLLLCLSMVLLGPRPGSSQELVPLEPQWLRDMYADGWQKVEEGVLRRDGANGKFETFSYGAEGIQWVIQGHEQQIRFLQEKYDASPTAELGEVIGRLKARVDRLSGNLGSAPAAESFDGETATACGVAYSAAASAGPQAAPQGVTATASAYFHDDCGSVADTFVLAYAEATDGTVHTVLSQDDPKQGSWIDSYATASAPGNTSCYSYAQADVSVNGSSIYQMGDDNYNCPVGVTASITGPSQASTDFYGPSCTDVTWTAGASGGNPGYTYTWYLNGVSQGTGPSLTKSYCGVNSTVAVKVVAQDALGWTDDATYTTTLSHRGAITASISGPSSVSTNSSTPCADVTWTASASSSGHSGYTYQWYIGTALQGSGATLTKRYCSTSQSVTVKVIARASQDAHADDATFTTSIAHSTAPLTASISGPASVPLATAGECKSITWTANPAGGSPGYTYSWYIGTGTTVQGTAATLTKSFCGAQTVNVKVTVRDSAGAAVSPTFTTTLNPALTVMINGDTYGRAGNGTCATLSWTAYPSGGTPGYTYSWYLNNGTTVVSTSKTYSRTVCNDQDFSVNVTARDAAAQTASATFPVTIDHICDVTFCP